MSDNLEDSITSEQSNVVCDHHNRPAKAGRLIAKDLACGELAEVKSSENILNRIEWTTAAAEWMFQVSQIQHIEPFFEKVQPNFK